jgi:hypothetical protein
MVLGAGRELSIHDADRRSPGDTGQHAQQYVGNTRWDHDAVPVGDGGSWDRHKAVLQARQPFDGSSSDARRYRDNGVARELLNAFGPMRERPDLMTRSRLVLAYQIFRELLVRRFQDTGEGKGVAFHTRSTVA